MDTFFCPIGVQIREGFQSTKSVVPLIHPFPYLQSSIQTPRDVHTASGCGSVASYRLLQLLQTSCSYIQYNIINSTRKLKATISCRSDYKEDNQ